VAGGEADDLAEELLIHPAEDVGGQNGEFIRGIRVVEPPEDLLERLVVDGEAQRESIRRRGAPLLLPEMKQAGVIPVVGPVEDLDETLINAGAVEEPLELAVGLDPPVLTDPEKDDPVDRERHRRVQLPLAQGGVSQRDGPCQKIPPGFNLPEEGLVHAGGALLQAGRFGVTVVRPL
jgi:hypothetical protein